MKFVLTLPVATATGQRKLNVKIGSAKERMLTMDGSTRKTVELEGKEGDTVTGALADHGGPANEFSFTLGESHEAGDGEVGIEVLEE